MQSVEVPSHTDQAVQNLSNIGETTSKSSMSIEEIDE
jgi:hypothetical protein